MRDLRHLLLTRASARLGALHAFLAIALLGSCVSSSPAPPKLSPGESILEAAESATERGDWRAAAHYWNRVLLESEEPGPRPYLETARALYELGDEEGSQILLDRGIELFPRDVELHLMRGVLLRERGFRRAAELDFHEVTELDPENAEAWFELGRVLYELDLPVRAAACLKERVRLAGEEEETLYLLGRAWAENGRLEEAVDCFETGLDSPDVSAERLVEAASIVSSERFKRVREPFLECALRWVDRAIEADPQHAEANYVRGRLLEIGGRGKEALVAYERAVELDNFHLPAMARVADLYAREGQIARADQMIDRALDLNLTTSRREMLERLRASWHSQP
jgi:tetratricopeptide (TPR) repeat protein